MQKQEYASTLVSVSSIQPCFFQSRMETVDESFLDLVESIKKYGVLEPVIVRTVKVGYELVAGDRRLRAAKKLGLTLIPVVIRDLSDEDAFFLQATENLQRQGLSEDEKKRIVSESAKRYKLDANGVAEKLGMSYSWVVKYLPSEFKNGEKAEAGKLGGLAKGMSYRDEGAILNIAECEFCTVSTSEAKEWEGHKLCLPHYAEALSDPAKFKRFFGFQQQTPVIAEHVASRPLDSWEERKAHMSPEHSEMESTIATLLMEKGIRPVLTNQKYCLLSTIPDFVFPSSNLAVYLDGKAVHNGRQLDRDDELRDLLRKRHGMRVLSITYGSKSKGEVDRIFNEIAREVKKE